MTAFDRFDPFAGRVSSALEEIAPTTRPAYLDNVLAATAATRQRPRWTFPGRLLPMDTALSRSTLPRVPGRMLALLLVVLLLAIAAVAVFIGSRNRIPPPYGLADNGQVAYGSNGDIYVRDSLGSDPRLLIGGDGQQGGVAYSLDGRSIAYDSVVNGEDHVTVADADGSHPRVVLDIPFTNGSASWSPDSRSIALVTDRIVEDAPNVFVTKRTLFIAPADGSGAREVPIEGLSPLDVIYNPANDGTLVIRGAADGAVDLYLVTTEGRVLRSYDLPGRMLYGTDWELGGVAVSPDGRTIAHNVVDDATGAVTFRTWLVDINGTKQRLLPLPVGATSTYSQAWSVYSPDGAWIAMESWDGTPGGPATNQIAIAPADGSGPAHGVGPKIENQSLLKAWSPDGKSLLLGVRDQNEVYEIDPSTSVGRKLPWTGDLPDWQRVIH